MSKRVRLLPNLLDSDAQEFDIYETALFPRLTLQLIA